MVQGGVTKQAVLMIVDLLIKKKKEMKMGMEKLSEEFNFYINQEEYQSSTERKPSRRPKV